MAAAARSADERYASARDFQADLEAWLRKQAIVPGTVEIAVYMRGLFARRRVSRLDPLQRRAPIVPAAHLSRGAPQFG